MCKRMADRYRLFLLYLLRRRMHIILSAERREKEMKLIRLRRAVLYPVGRIYCTYVNSKETVLNSRWVIQYRQMNKLIQRTVIFKSSFSYAILFLILHMEDDGYRVETMERIGTGTIHAS